jgi:hypothetical protein
MRIISCGFSHAPAPDACLPWSLSRLSDGYNVQGQLLDASDAQFFNATLNMRNQSAYYLQTPRHRAW